MMSGPEQPSALAHEVRAALARGWALTPLEGKRPIRKNWTAADVPEDDLLAHVARGENIGVRTGAASGVVVLDFDGDLAQHADLLERLPATWECVSGSGGRHLYFRHTAPLGNSAGKLAPHADVKADGGQVVLAGSVHPVTGKLYKWADGRSPEDLELASLPAWVLDRLAPPKAERAPVDTRPLPGACSPYAAAALKDECATVAAAPEGTRNDALNAAAFSLGQLVAGGELGEVDVVDALRDAAQAAGLPPGEVGATIRSGLSKGQAEPRTAPPRDPGHCLAWGDEAAEATAPTAEGELLPVLHLPPDWRETVIPPRRFALAPAFPVGVLTVLFAAGGTGKSTLLLTACASVCLGRELVPGWRPEREGRALLMIFEDDFNEVHRRLQRIASAHRFSTAEADRLADALAVVCGPGGDFFRVGPGGTVCPGPALEQLRRTVTERGPFDLVVIDPKAALLGGSLDENGNALAQRVAGLLAACVGPDCAVVLADHTSKAERATAGSARGAGAWTDASRQSWGMRPLSESEARTVPETDRPLLRVLSLLKGNYGAPILPVFLRQSTAAESAGILQAFDLGALKADSACRRQNELRAAVLGALQETPSTLAEITGHARGSAEAKARGQRVREDVSGRLGCPVSTRELQDAVRDLLADGELITEIDPQRRHVLRVGFPVNGEEYPVSGMSGRCRANDLPDRGRDMSGSRANPPLGGLPCPTYPDAGADGERMESLPDTTPLPDTNRPEGS